MLVQTIFGMDKSKKLGDYVNALQALCEQYNVETDKIAIVEATEEYYLFLVKQEKCYDSCIETLGNSKMVKREKDNVF